MKGALPEGNDSARLLDPHRRAVPGVERMRRYDDAEPVDLLVVGCGAGGSVLAQRLARRGWRVVVLEAGPFWDPDEDWVSDEAGSRHLYWTEPRVIGGADPVELGSNNSGRGVGGSMTHYAGYAPRFHPSDFATRTVDGVGADWPYGYAELRPHYELVERELPVAGEHWPWGDPHGYPHAPHPIGGAAEVALRGALAAGVEMRVGPVAITNGTFGNRPHCIYRGFCLQGCKVGAKGSPLVTHVPDALAHGTEIRTGAMAVRIEVEGGRCTGVEYVRDGRHCFQRAAAVAIAGYAIETPRLLLCSDQRGHPRGLGNAEDLVGRFVMAQGAPQIGGRFPELLRVYKAPPARDLERAVLRDVRRPRLRARVQYPDRRAAADRLGGARARGRPLGQGAARVHARLQPLDGAGRAVRTAAAGGEPRHAGGRARPAPGCPLRAWTTPSATTTGRTSPMRSG